MEHTKREQPIDLSLLASMPNTQSSFDRFFSSQIMDQYQEPLTWNNHQVESFAPESPLEPSPINTKRMTVVEHLDLRGVNYTFAGSTPFPVSQLYDTTFQADYTASNVISNEEEGFFLPNTNSTNDDYTHHISTQKLMLGTDMQALEREDRYNKEEDSSHHHDEEPILCHERPPVLIRTSSRSPVPNCCLERVPSSNGVGREQNHSDRWNDKFTELRAFIQANGHARIPVRYKQNLPLSKWAKRQRYQWKLKQEGKHSTLTDSREVLLDELGFLWDIRMTIWEERFEDLLQYQKANGHCNVPVSCVEYPKLGTWVKCQRRQWKLRYNGQQSSMTPSRSAKLEAIGFSWEATHRPLR
jgi:hypothetical protein